MSLALLALIGEAALGGPLLAVSQRFGIHVERITLWLLGGVTEFNDETPASVDGPGTLRSASSDAFASLKSGYSRPVSPPRSASAPGRTYMPTVDDAPTAAGHTAGIDGGGWGNGSARPW